MSHLRAKCDRCIHTIMISPIGDKCNLSPKSDNTYLSQIEDILSSFGWSDACAPIVNLANSNSQNHRLPQQPG